MLSAASVRPFIACAQLILEKEGDKSACTNQNKHSCQQHSITFQWKRILIYNPDRKPRYEDRHPMFMTIRFFYIE